MEINKRNNTRYSVSAFVVIMVIALHACQEADDVPPVITLIGQDSIQITLNSDYVEQGAKVIDDTEGDISSQVYIENNVNTNLYGEYEVIYKAIDNAGNEAIPVSRYVRVINSAWIYIGNYEATETEFYPAGDTCSYPVFVWIDSTVNYRLDFQDFACNSGFSIYADVLDTTLIIPYQVVGDSTISMILQGQGTINDTLISLSYSKGTANTTTYSSAVFKKLK